MSENRNAFPWIAGCLMLACAAPTSAQSYPTRPVVIVAPVPPGGGVDRLARLIATRLSENFKQPVLVENRPGAGNIVGADYVAKAKPDGYTLVLANNSSHGVAQAVDPKVPYDCIKDFTPISAIAHAEHLVVTHPRIPAATLKEFIELAKRRPGELNFGSAGSGTQTHLSVELLKYRTRTNMVHVPYKGTGPALTALAVGEIQLLFATTTAAMPLVKSGRFKALAITGLKRSESLPDVPTLASQDIKGFETAAWYGVAGPAGMPKPVVALLNQEIVKIVKSAEFGKQITRDGVEPLGSTPEEFVDIVKAELAKWSSLVAEAGLHLN